MVFKLESSENGKVKLSFVGNQLRERQEIILVVSFKMFNIMEYH